MFITFKNVSINFYISFIFPTQSGNITAPFDWFVQNPALPIKMRPRLDVRNGLLHILVYLCLFVFQQNLVLYTIR